MCVRRTRLRWVYSLIISYVSKKNSRRIYLMRKYDQLHVQPLSYRVMYWMVIWEWWRSDRRVVVVVVVVVVVTNNENKKESGIFLGTFLGIFLLLGSYFFLLYSIWLGHKIMMHYSVISETQTIYFIFRHHSEMFLTMNKKQHVCTVQTMIEGVEEMEEKMEILLK